jgi:hypothetical protein
MQAPNTNEEFTQSTTPGQKVGAGESVSPARELSSLLSRAGEIAASMGMELDTWMRAAWSAYVDAKPGLREHLEDMHLLAELEALRQSGKIGQA